MSFMTAGCSIHILRNHKAMSEYAAHLLSALVEGKPDAVLGVSAGETPELTYKLLGKSGVDASRVTLIAVDQTILRAGTRKTKDNDYKTYVEEMIVGRFPDGMRPKRIYVPDMGDVTEEQILDELRKKPHEYEMFGSEIRFRNPTGAFEEVYRRIKAFQEILKGNTRDLQMLGLPPGEHPHMAYDDYPTDPESRTHLVRLYDETLRAASRFFDGDMGKVWQFGITEGPVDILESTGLLLLVSGKKKAEAIATTFATDLVLNEEALRWASSRNVRRHDNLAVVLDRDAAEYILPRLDDIRRVYESEGRSLDVRKHF